MPMKMNSIAILGAMATAGCAVSGGWQGATAEKAYDKDLEAQRMVAVINNDDYYEYHMDGRIYVLADAKDVKSFLSSGEIPFRVTKVGAGPKGETVVFAIAAPEKNKKDGFGAVEIFEGRRKGYEKDFYAEVLRQDQYYVFGDWVSLEQFRRQGQFAAARSDTAPDGKKVQFAQASDTIATRFKGLHTK